MDLKLTETEKEIAKELLAKLDELYTDKASLEVRKRSREESIKTEVCQILNIKNKKGEPLPNKIKLSLLMPVIEEKIEKTVNKEQLRYDTMCEYRNAVNSLSKDSATSLLNVRGEIKAIDLDIKSAFTEGDAASLSGEVIEALNLIAKDNYAQTKNNKMAEAGFKVKETSKNSKADLAKLKKALIEALKE